MSKNVRISHSATKKTIRFPTDVVAQAQNVCKQQGQSFSEFVLEAVRSALNDLHSDEIG